MRINLPGQKRFLRWFARGVRFKFVSHFNNWIPPKQTQYIDFSVVPLMKYNILVLVELSWHM